MLRTFTLLLAASTFMVLPLSPKEITQGPVMHLLVADPMDCRAEDFIRRLLARFMRRPYLRVVLEVLSVGMTSITIPRRSGLHRIVSRVPIYRSRTVGSEISTISTCTLGKAEAGSM